MCLSVCKSERDGQTEGLLKHCNMLMFTNTFISFSVILRCNIPIGMGRFVGVKYIPGKMKEKKFGDILLMVFGKILE